MFDLNAIRRLYGEPGEGPPDEGAELKAMADLKAALDRLPPRRPEPSVIDAVVAAAGEAARPAALDPIRAAYDEGPADLDAEEAGSEVRALAGVKAALDVLPPRRPDASVIDAVVAAAGEAARTALGPIRVVYDEEPESLASEAAEAEGAMLSEMKAALDRLPPRRPEPSVIDAVVAATRPSTVVAVTGRAADRPVRRDTRRRVAAVLGAVFAVVLVFGGGLWLSREAPTPPEIAGTDRAEEQVAQAIPPAGGPSEASSRAEASEAAAPEVDAPEVDAPEAAAASSEATPAAPPPEGALLVAASRAPSSSADREAPPSARRAEPPAPADAAESFVSFDAPVNLNDLRLAGADVSSLAAETLSLNAEALALDDNEELRLLYLRLREMQAAQAGLGWGAPPVSLGAAPDSTPAQPATGWMQVRVRR